MGQQLNNILLLLAIGYDKHKPDLSACSTVLAHSSVIFLFTEGNQAHYVEMGKKLGYIFLIKTACWGNTQSEICVLLNSFLLSDK